MEKCVQINWKIYNVAHARIINIAQFGFNSCLNFLQLGEVADK